MVKSKDGATFRGRYLICTLPLNVLKDVEFRPALPKEKLQASSLGHNNLAVKAHAEVKGRDYRSWSATGSSTPMAGVFGDGLTPAGNSHLVSFSANSSYVGENFGFPEIKAAFDSFKDFEYERLVSHPILLPDTVQD